MTRNLTVLSRFASPRTSTNVRNALEPMEGRTLMSAAATMDVSVISPTTRPGVTTAINVGTPVVSGVANRVRLFAEVEIGPLSSTTRGERLNHNDFSSVDVAQPGVTESLSPLPGLATGFNDFATLIAED